MEVGDGFCHYYLIFFSSCLLIFCIFIFHCQTWFFVVVVVVVMEVSLLSWNKCFWDFSSSFPMHLTPMMHLCFRFHWFCFFSSFNCTSRILSFLGRASCTHSVCNYTWGFTSILIDLLLLIKRKWQGGFSCMLHMSLVILTNWLKERSFSCYVLCRDDKYCICAREYI